MAMRWSIAELLKNFQTKTIRDFEGFVGSDEVLKCFVIAPTSPSDTGLEGGYFWNVFCDDCPPKLINAVRDISLNMMHEMIDQGDYPEEHRAFMAEAIVYTVKELLTVPQWTKSGLPEIK